jgi:hypothetical protein
MSIALGWLRDAHVSRLLMLCYAMLCYAMLCYAMLCYAMLCCAMLCYAMLCYAMLCYAMLCYAMLCYAMLCYAMPLSSPPPLRLAPRGTAPTTWRCMRQAGAVSVAHGIILHYHPLTRRVRVSVAHGQLSMADVVRSAVQVAALPTRGRIILHYHPLYAPPCSRGGSALSTTALAPRCSAPDHSIA